MEIRRRLLMMFAEGGTSGLELIKTYNVTESWETDSTGNPVSIMQTLFTQQERSDFGYNDYLVVDFENNANASNNKAIWMIVGARDNYGLCMRGATTYRNIAASTSFYVASGTTIKVYKGNVYNV